MAKIYPIREKPVEPYLDQRYRPHKWFGTPPPRKNANNPPCPNCATNERVEIHQYAIVDSEGLFHSAIYHCFQCGKHF